ncbi:unnamed protein product [Symbiodinium pilosum]|uniref:Uncharacterized protein n=1 Tax=Symbiodinium pilosum TaxID=2952 RepID=A0A812PW61_SYMPI|nr:unnamed protein product [Symbiodinium pilosum]
MAYGSLAEAEAKESADDMQAEEAATAEDNGNDGNDGTDTATEAMAISDGPSRRIYQNSNATATVLESDAASSAATKANSSQTALHSVEDSSGSAGEQGLAEAADAQSVAELSAENTEGLEEGSDEAESEELNRGAAQACIGTMIEKCPSDKTDACKTKDAGTCVNVFHKCKDDRMVQCVACTTFDPNDPEGLAMLECLDLDGDQA